ncbi:MAG TPA: SDR family NAD(P)-dependent oxidoreductase [Candidatus Dormibacteraeota bacterium]|nr:SDR family NAD(P)-dependent oxidoreductase [Candidatus Dormibacteraeota bacterium]
MSVPGARAPRSALITGAAGGLGAAIATALHASSVQLLLIDVAADPLHHLGERLGAHTIVADVADADDRQRIIDRCQSLDVGPDVLINNAGVERASRFVDLQPAEIRHALDVNLLGAMLLTHALLPKMQRRGRGHVISIASMAAIKPVPYNAVYNTAKAGLVAFSTSLSKELDGTGVHATVICPAAVREVGMWARASDRLSANRLVDSSTVSAEAVVAAVTRAIARRPRRVLVGSPVVRAGALLSALSPGVDRATDRLSGIDAIYRERIHTDRDNRL